MPISDVPPNPLTDKEVETLRMLAAGLTPQQIAARDYVEGTAVSNRVARAAVKLGTKTTTHTVVVALCRGYLKNSPYARR